MATVDRDEARFAQASRQMMGSSTLRSWVIPMLQDRERLNKPAMIYWAQALSAGVLSGWDPALDAIWMYRVPSLIAAIVTVFATWRIGMTLIPGVVGARTGLLAGLILAASPLIAWEARQARSDHLLLMWTTLAMWALAGLWGGHRRSADRGASRAHVGALWVLVGLGAMTKGPITAMVVLLSVLTLCRLERSWGLARRVRPVLGVCVALGVLLPWVVLVGREVGLGRYASIVLSETVGRGVSAREGHWGPPGYHLAFAFVMLWPGGMLLAPAIWRGIARTIRRDEAPMRRVGLSDRARGAGSILRRLGGAARFVRGLRAGPSRDLETFCVAWIVPTWIVFEFYGTKLPHYPMVLYPALALLVARCVLASAGGAIPGLYRGGARVGVIVWALIGLGVLAGAPGLIWAVGGARGSVVLGVASIACNVVVGGLLVAAWRLAAKEQWLRAQVLGLAAAGIGLVTLLGIVLPRSPEPWVSERAARALLAHDAGGARPLAAVRFHEDSLIFHTRGRVERIGEDELAPWLDAHADGLVLLPSEMGEGLRVLEVVEGFNYSKGERVRLAVAERARGDGGGDAGATTSGDGP